MPRIGTITTWISLAIGAWAIFWPYPPAAVGAVLLAAPWAALALIAAFAGRLNLYPNWNAPAPAVPDTAGGMLRKMWTARWTGQVYGLPRPDRPPAIAGLMSIPCVILIWKATLGGHPMGLAPLLPYMAGLGALVAGAAWIVDKSVAEAKIGGAWLFAIAAIYGVCGVLLANQDFDLASYRTFPTSILEHETTTSGITRTLTLSPWDPAAVGYSRDVMVSALAFSQLEGNPVCATEHPGALGVRWFTLGRCA